MRNRFSFRTRPDCGLTLSGSPGGALQVSGSTQDTCTFTIARLDATGVSGSFDCPDVTFRDPSRGDIGKGRVKGTFEAKV